MLYFWSQASAQISMFRECWSQHYSEYPILIWSSDSNAVFCYITIDGVCLVTISLLYSACWSLVYLSLLSLTLETCVLTCMHLMLVLVRWLAYRWWSAQGFDWPACCRIQFSYDCQIVTGKTISVQLPYEQFQMIY